MPSLVISACLFCAFCQVQANDNGHVAAIRFAHFEVLTQQYQNANKNGEEYRTSFSPELTREFVPKFLALAKENPDDEAAFRCCEWIVAHCRFLHSITNIDEAETIAWNMLASNRSDDTRLPMLCLEAAKIPSPAREQFLRSLPNDYRQPVEVHGHAFLALAELLSKKSELKHAPSQIDEESPAELRTYYAGIGAPQLRRESGELFQHVLDHYADIPYAPGTQGEDVCKTLGDRAAKKLGELQNPQLVRKATPNAFEMPAQRFDHLSGN